MSVSPGQQGSEGHRGHRGHRQPASMCGAAGECGSALLASFAASFAQSSRPGRRTTQTRELAVRKPHWAQRVVARRSAMARAIASPLRPPSGSEGNGASGGPGAVSEFAGRPVASAGSAAASTGACAVAIPFGPPRSPAIDPVRRSWTRARSIMRSNSTRTVTPSRAASSSTQARRS